MAVQEFAWCYSLEPQIGVNGCWLECSPEHRAGLWLHGSVNIAVSPPNGFLGGFSTDTDDITHTGIFRQKMIFNGIRETERE